MKKQKNKKFPAISQKGSSHGYRFPFLSSHLLPAFKFNDFIAGFVPFYDSYTGNREIKVGSNYFNDFLVGFPFGGRR